MDEKKRYDDDDDDHHHVFCTPYLSCKFEEKFKKVSFFEQNFDTQRKFLDDWIMQKQ